MDTLYPPDKRPNITDIIHRDLLTVSHVKVTDGGYSACLTVSFADTSIDIFFPLGTIYVGVERQL